MPEIWNRKNLVGYKVIFVPISGVKPSGPPIDFVIGFRTPEGKARGRSVGVAVGDNGALFVADDLSKTVWCITRKDLKRVMQLRVASSSRSDCALQVGLRLPSH